ncbi:YdhK family protein (plasmid) [Alkalihalobacillus hwajinpoensis]|uniref:YdhK family protein n=1 Tax=Guptibacillus hwajinpoensis TaxID=208199 RepID=UPI001883831D|nr:YdhK family protein [Pseudalkalibacillus hwajinpoensis]MBF0706703.1 YdhK family protein [Pseudalkalibacillus hwajinpoensis]
MKKNISAIAFTLFILSLFLVACGNNENMNEGTNTGSSNMDSDSGESMDSMNHAESSDIPEGLKEANNPTYEVGSNAIITANHMKGMDGAEATIKGAYQTTAYVISYTPTSGGEKVDNHKWVIQEEIEEAGGENLEEGMEVTITASHMEGMNGAKAIIDSENSTTVYMVDYMPTTGGEEVTNHKWVTESELTVK